MSSRILKVIFIVLVTITLTSCGGGGGGSSSGGGGEFNKYFVLIQGPVFLEDSYQTDNPTVNLSGTSFVPVGATCSGIIGTIPDGYQVTVSNSANNESRSASISLGCFLQVNVIWEENSVPLVVGVNNITVTATDSAGNTGSDTLQVNRVVDTTLPTIVDNSPADGATGIDSNFVVTVTFSEDMDSTTINSANLRIMNEFGTLIDSAVFYPSSSLIQNQATIIPLVPLFNNVTYTAVVTTGATDAVGNALMEDFSFSFTTGATSFTTSANPDMAPPTVVSVSPPNGSTCSPANVPVTATFSETIDSATLDSDTFSLTGPGNNLEVGTVTYNNPTATFAPVTPLSATSMYIANLTTGITDLAGNSLAAPYSWSFSTNADGGTGTWIPTNVTDVPVARSSHVAVWDGTEMIIAGGGSNQYGRYDPTTGIWTVASDGPAVSDSRAVWTGSHMLMWGPGMGYIFNPMLDRWDNISSAGQPSVRFSYTAIWTGTEMIIWGGRLFPTEYGDGARYNPVTDTWQPVSIVNAPSPRQSHTAVWTGTEMIVWGGGADGLTIGNGARYNPTTDTWTAMSNAGAPVLSGHVAVWTGSKMVVWGSLTGAGGIYDPNANSWTAIDNNCAPTGRLSETAIWTGERMIIWGGTDNRIVFGDGYEFDPVSNSWRKLSNITAPSARSNHTAIWTGGQMIIWGGSNGSGMNTGGHLHPRCRC